MAQPARFRSTQVGAAAHDTEFSAAAPTEMALLVASRSPVLALSMIRMLLCTCATSVSLVTTTVAVELLSELSAS